MRTVRVEAEAAARFRLLPSDDPARTLLSVIFRLVPVSHWRFGRVHGAETISSFTAGDAGLDLSAERERFLSDVRRQRPRGAPRLTLVPQPDGAYAHGVDLAFVDPLADFSMLTLLRDEQAGTFSANELALLALAVESGADFLAPAGIDRERDERTPPLQEREMPVLFVLDRDYRIVMGRHVAVEGGTAHGAFGMTFGDRLPYVIEEAVRDLTAGWADDPSASLDGVAMPLPSLAVRTQALSSSAEPYVGVLLERVRGRNALRRAAARYTITHRERQVLALLLDGKRIDEIALQLGIAPSTVQDHVKSLITRTRAANRSQMLARILGWEPSESDDDPRELPN